MFICMFYPTVTISGLAGSNCCQDDIILQVSRLQEIIYLFIY